MIDSPQSGVHTAAPRWHRIYFILATIVLVAIALSLALASISCAGHKSSIEANRRLAKYVVAFTELSEAAGALTAAGHDIVRGNNSEKAATRLEQAKLKLRDRIRAARRATKEARREQLEDAGINMKPLISGLALIEAAQERLAKHVASIEGQIANGDQQIAAKRLVALDTELAAIQQAVASLTHHAVSQQELLLNHQVTSAATLRNREVTITAGVILVVISVLWYGHCLGRRFAAAHESNRRLRSFLASTIESAPNGLLLVDEHGVIRHVNRAVCEIFGYDSKEMAGMPLSQVVPRKVRARHDGLVKEFLTNPVRRPMTSLQNIAGVRKDGGRVYVEVRLSSVEFDGEVFALATVIDVSARKQLEEESKQHTQLLQALSAAQERFIHGASSKDLLSLVLTHALDTTDSAFGFIAETLDDGGGAPFIQVHAIRNCRTLDTGGIEKKMVAPYLRIRDAQNLFGRAVTSGEIVIGSQKDQDLQSEYLPFDHPPLTNFLAIPFKRGPCVVGTLCLANTPQGYSREDVRPLMPYVTTCATFLAGWKSQRDKERALQELKGSLADLAETRAKLESRGIELEFKANELEAERSKAENASRAKSDFLANMSHEIRTPMTAILGYADLLLEEGADPNPERLFEMSNTIKRNGEHLLSLLNDILDLSKIEAGGMTIETISIDTLDILQDVEELMQDRANSKDLALRFATDGEIPTRITTDPTRLKQILVNLVGNAIKFTAKGGVSVVVSVDQNDPNWLAFDVTDTGIGMTADEVSQLFRPFMQADSSISRKFGGTGLGLSISRKLAKKLGGDVTVLATEPNRGTTFRVTIQAGDATDQTSRSASHQDQQSAKPATSINNIPPGTRVLVAEDNPDNQRLISFLLEKAGGDITLVENGEQAHSIAMAQLREGAPFDVILMDMQMPIMDGIAATRALRSNGYQFPIIALTANGMVSDREKCMQAGCDDHALKPIDRSTLFATICRNLRTETVPDMQFGAVNQTR